MIKLTVLIIFAAALIWLARSSMSSSASTPFGVALQQNGFYRIEPSGLDPKNIAIAFSVKTRMPGIVFSYGVWGFLEPVTRNHSSLVISIDSTTGQLTVTRTSRSVDIAMEPNSHHKIVSPSVVMDGRWHSVVFSIKETIATLTIDNKNPMIARWPVTSFDMSASAAFIGGAPDLRNEDLLSGCVKNIMFGTNHKTTFYFVPSERTTRLGVTIPSVYEWCV